jgi:hypothetical protein
MTRRDNFTPTVEAAAAYEAAHYAHTWDRDDTPTLAELEREEAESA